MRKWEIDINCDVGEGFGNEADLFPHITSCNIACGGHAGDTTSMENVVRLGISEGLKMGAHPSYPDRENFGRLTLNIPMEALLKSVRKQIDDLVAILEEQGSRLHHIKAHGALYNELATNPRLADAYLATVQPFTKYAALMVPYRSVIAKKARQLGYRIWVEAFADRNYNEDYTLVARNQPGALIEAPDLVLEHMIRMVRERKLQTLSGKLIPLEADTYCIHGDTPSALQILTYLGRELPGQGIYLKK